MKYDGKLNVTFSLSVPNFLSVVHASGDNLMKFFMSCVESKLFMCAQIWFEEHWPLCFARSIEILV